MQWPWICTNTNLTYKRSHPEMFLKISPNIQRNIFAGVYLFPKLPIAELQIYLKEAQTQILFYTFCEILTSNVECKFCDIFQSSVCTGQQWTLHKKWSFSLNIFSVNVTNSAVMELVIFTKEVLYGKLHFCAAEMLSLIINFPINLWYEQRVKDKNNTNPSST